MFSIIFKALSSDARFDFLSTAFLCVDGRKKGFKNLKCEDKFFITDFDAWKKNTYFVFI